MMNKRTVGGIVLLLRPAQWTKNLFVFLPMFFDGHLLEWSYISSALQVFVSWCLMASAVYCLNDIRDRQYDKLHPVKSKRPIASGAITVGQAYIIMAFCLLAAFIMLSPYGLSRLCMISGLYLIANILYSVCLKRIAIVDVFIIAMGYVFRIWAGGTVSDVSLSHWIVLMVFLLSLFLAFAKRRNDIVLYNDGMEARCGIARYDVWFVNQALSILASVIVVCYVMYTVSEDVIARYQSPHLYLTSVFVLAGLFRYLLLIAKGEGGSPANILVKDRFIQVCIMGWGIVYYILIYE